MLLVGLLNIPDVIGAVLALHLLESDVLTLLALPTMKLLDLHVDVSHVLVGHMLVDHVLVKVSNTIMPVRHLSSYLHIAPVCEFGKFHLNSTWHLSKLLVRAAREFSALKMAE